MLETSSAAIPVRELNRLVRSALESSFSLMWISGEVSNLARASSGHVYFSLKDDAAQVRCVMFRSRAQVVPWKLENGQQVEARALVSFYEPRGEFQLAVESLRQAGLGSLFEAFARLKAKLLEEGLLAADRKRTLPRFPRAIGIVTSPGAAALADVVAALRRRAPQIPLLLYPTVVQGDGAAIAIRTAIETAGRRCECDVLLLVRGGGSTEDLWAFNDEAMARCIIASPVPVVSGIGHDTDTTIADFVADVHAPTPTAAAEIVSQGWHEAKDKLALLGAKLQRAIDAPLARAAQALDRLEMRLLHPRQRFRENRARMRLAGARLTSNTLLRVRETQHLLGRLESELHLHGPQPERLKATVALREASLLAATVRNIQVKRGRLDALTRSLEILDPEATLERGYSIVRNASGRLISDVRQICRDQPLSLQFSTGGATVRVLELDERDIPPLRPD